MIDVAIVGGGPAGLTASIYAARAGMKTTIFEALVIGGQLTSIDNLENYPGFTNGINGFDIAMNLRGQAERFGVTIASEQVTSLKVNDDGTFTLTTSAGEHQAKTVIIATGAKPRKPENVPLDHLEGKGVSYCATCDGAFFRGQEVVVVGGGDTACADCIYLANFCPSVHLVHRRDTLKAHYFYAERVKELENVHIHWDSELKDVKDEDGHVASVVIENVKTGEESSIDCRGLFLAIGSVPKTEWLAGVVDRTPDGYIITDEMGRTNVPGIYAAGDVRTTSLRQVITAAADGALAAEAAVDKLNHI